MTVIHEKLAFMPGLEGDAPPSRVQAEVLSDPIHDAMAEAVATKADLA